MRKLHHLRLLAAVGACGALVGLAGCGDDLSGESSTKAKSDTSADGSKDGGSGADSAEAKKLGDEIAGKVSLGGVDSAVGDASDTGDTTDKTTDNTTGDTTGDTSGSSDGQGSGDLDLDSSDEACLGGSLIDDLGLDEATALVNGGDVDFGSLDADQKEAVADAFDSCIEPDVITGALATELATQFGGSLPDGTEECFSSELDGNVGTFIVEAAAADSTGETPDSVVSLFDSCIPLSLVLEAGAKQAGVELTSEQLDCVAEALDGKVSWADLISEDPAAGQAISEATAGCVG